MTDVVLSEKCCTGCGKSKPLSEFYRSRDNAAGYRARCKACLSDDAKSRSDKPRKPNPGHRDAEVFHEGPIVGRHEARDSGLDRYFTGKPCRNGHVAQRYIKGGCIVCKGSQSKRWREENLERHAELQAEWYVENKTHHLAYGLAWNRRNRGKRAAISKRWREKNPQKVNSCRRSWKARNPDRVREHDRRKEAKRRTLAKWIIASRMRGRMYYALRRGGSSKNGESWQSFVPYSVDDLVSHLKKTMPKGYSWQDVMDGKLHVDHKIPIAAFSFSSPDDIDFQRCWALSNLRLLPASENCSKGAKLDKPFQPSLSGI